ncbi:MAG: PIN domain-containing protein [Gammaproteobacteria bacterium]|nr:PIN domain-containing protein [Gammaproteobacteria bacterium]MDE0226965.1 PIN domain-containing protein [Gammaproteobacteria bacterium]MDE0453258.1 PIN domain-containing protein [Gammaproteobacteria bacterium]
MSLFVDTSAILAIIDADQPRHRDVVEAFDLAIDTGDPLFTSNYVLVETFALAQRRLGLPASRDLAVSFVPLLNTLWVDESIHETALSVLLASGRRSLSLVDCTSFEIMRRHGLTQALALDRDFQQQGFQVAPAS